MRVREVLSHLRSAGGIFAMVVAAALGVVIGGDAFSRGDGGKATADAETGVSRQVLQDGSDWLSEAFWERKRRQRLGARAQRDFPDRRNPFSVYGEEAGGPVSRDRGLYRTVCVRMCDGYYFPISFSTTRDRFARDEQVCRSKCSGDVRLFYYPSGDPDAEELKDRRGNPYTELANAFVYRTSYKPACQCRAQPWSDEARQRHAMYASEAWQEEARRLARVQELKARGQGRRQWRIVVPLGERDEGGVETAAVPGEGDAAASDNPFGVNVVRPGRSQRMGLGGDAGRASSGRRPRVIRRDRSWRKRVFNNPGD